MSIVRRNGEIKSLTELRAEDQRERRFRQKLRAHIECDLDVLETLSVPDGLLVTLKSRERFIVTATYEGIAK